MYWFGRTLKTEVGGSPSLNGSKTKLKVVGGDLKFQEGKLPHFEGHLKGQDAMERLFQNYTELLSLDKVIEPQE